MTVLQELNLLPFFKEVHINSTHFLYCTLQANSKDVIIILILLGDELMYTVKYCPICKKDLPNPYCIPEYFIRCNKPKEHDIAQFVDTGLSENDFTIINYISEEPFFLESMLKLKEENPIEYQLKMSQFKANVAQQESAKVSNKNTVKCPKCGCTDIGVSNRGYSIVWGFIWDW